MVSDANAVIRDVADTALWMASLRAVESGRDDAVFADRLAALLAGDRGPAIARRMPPASVVGWGLVVRTSAIDRLVVDAVEGGVDTVINLGAGMDTRPYRLPLPSRLRWVEWDLPVLMDQKNRQLREHQAVCRVERVGADLRDAPLRRKLLLERTSGAASVLVIAEGVIPYFSNADVAELAGDLLAVPSVSGWILDYDNAGKRKEPRRWANNLKRAPFLFAADDWFAFFAGIGWQARRTITSAEESERIRRPYPNVFPSGLLMRVLPAEVRRRVLSASGAVLLGRRPGSA
jgi:methyltransferase (TIGR00027 family)